MNILWLANFLPVPETNGGKVVTMNRMREVAKRHRIWLITVNPDRVSETEMSELKALCEELIVLDAPQVSKFALLTLWKTPFNVVRLYSEKWEEAIGNVLQRVKFDLINIDIPMVFANLDRYFDSIKQIPVIINQQNIEFLSVRSKVHAQNISPLRRLYSRLESAALEKWERRLYSRLKNVAYTFVSSRDMEYFQKNLNTNNSPLFLSPIGTYVHTLRPDGQKVIPGRIIYVASFDYFPNIQGAVWMCREVFPAIKAKVPEAELYLVGRNPDEEVKRLARKDIVVTGTVKDLGEYYKSAALAVIPILSGGGVKTKLIEAGGYGMPVVSTTQGWLGTAYVQGEDMLIADQARDFADSCVQLLQSPERAEEMGKSIYARTKEKYQWENVANDYCGFIERIASEQNREQETGVTT